MKKIKTYSTQFKTIPEQPAQLHNQNKNQNHSKKRKSYQKIGENL